MGLREALEALIDQLDQRGEAENAPRVRVCVCVPQRHPVGVSRAVYASRMYSQVRR